MNPESIEAHCNQGTRIESAIARQGRLLAGDWTPPRCRTEDLDVVAEDIERNLDIATGDLRSTFVALCDVAFKGGTYEPRIVEYSQQGGGDARKDDHRRVRALADRGARPESAGDTARERLPRARRGAEARRRFAAALRALDGNTKVAHEARYHKGPVERLARTAERIAGTLRLQTEWLRWYATHNPEMREAAVAAGREIADAAGFVEGLRGFDRLAPDLQARVRTWGDEGQSIADAFRRRDRGPTRAHLIPPNRWGHYPEPSCITKRTGPKTPRATRQRRTTAMRAGAWVAAAATAAGLAASSVALAQSAAERAVEAGQAVRGCGDQHRVGGGPPVARPPELLRPQVGGADRHQGQGPSRCRRPRCSPRSSRSTGPAPAPMTR